MNSIKMENIIAGSSGSQGWLTYGFWSLQGRSGRLWSFRRVIGCIAWREWGRGNAKPLKVTLRDYWRREGTQTILSRLSLVECNACWEERKGSEWMVLRKASPLVWAWPLMRWSLEWTSWLAMIPQLLPICVAYFPGTARTWCPWTMH